MAITIEWATHTINVPRNDMLLIQSSPVEIRQLSLETLRLRLRDLEDDEEGIVFPVTHEYSAPTPIGGVTLAPVIEILDPYTITFEDGQYAVNVVGGNTNLADKVNINQVSIRTSNSAGLQELSSLQSGSFDRQMVAVSQASSITGTVFPRGTRTHPVNNFADAKAIADQRGFSGFIVMGAATLSSGDFISGYTFRGDNAITTVLTIEPDSDTTNAVFENLYISGTLDGNNVFRDCRIGDVSYVSGVLYNCGCEGEITMTPGSILAITESSSGTSQTVIDLGGSGSLYARGFSGTVTLKNFSGGTDSLGRPAAVVMDMDQGEVIVGPTVTGTVKIRGLARVTDNSNGAATIIDETGATGTITGGSVDINVESLTKQINRSVQAAIPALPSASTIWDAAPKHLKKAPKTTDYSEAIRTLNDKIDSLYQAVSPSKRDNMPTFDMQPLMDAIENSRNQDRIDEVLERISQIRMPDSSSDLVALNDQLIEMKAEVEAITESIVEVREEIGSIPPPDLSQIATKDELSAMRSLVEKLSNYDDAQVRRMLEAVITNTESLPDDAERISRKVDLVLDNQLGAM